MISNKRDGRLAKMPDSNKVWQLEVKKAPTYRKSFALQSMELVKGVGILVCMKKLETQ